MRVAVIGAGITGVTTAHALGTDGHEVTVFERAGSVAAEASFAEGGLLAPGYFALREALLQPDSSDAGWLRRLRGRASTGAQARRQARQQAIAQLGRHSRRCLHALVDALGLEPQPAAGLLVLLRHERERGTAEVALRSLEALDVEGTLADPAACLRLEPGLSDEAALAGGVHLPQDEVGNARQFAQALKAAATTLGVRFTFHRQVLGLEPSARPRLRHAALTPPTTPTTSTYGFSRHADSAADEAPPPTDFDAVVVCAGADALPLLGANGLRLPLVNLHGSSVTAPLREPSVPGLGPVTAVIDGAKQTSVARIGQRVRVAGPLRAGRPPRDEAAGAEPLYAVLHDWFPGVARLAQAQVWRGRCAASSDGLPLLGASGLPGVWLNLGHGGAGWTWACGSARLLADQLAGRDSAVDPARFGVQRFSV